MHPYVYIKNPPSTTRVDSPLIFDNSKVQEVLDTYRDFLGRVGEVLEYQRERYNKIFI